MRPIKKIMAAIAFSGHAKGLFKYTATIARAFDADVIVLNVINQRDVNAVRMVSSLGYEVDGDHYVQGIEDERRTRFEELVKEAGFPHDRVKLMFEVGSPVETLLETAVEEDVDMIVMGVKGRSDLEHVFVGSVAEKMFRRSPITIVSYRDENTAERLMKRIHSH